MGKIRRFLAGSWAILRSLILKLNSIRRLLLVVSLFLTFIVGTYSFGDDNSGATLDLRIVGYLIMLLVLLLELKDKLLARDELAAGRKVQFALLPKDPPYISGWDVWLYTRPANEVGGDLVDYLELEDGRLGLVLGDVAGKGLGAALYMAKLQAVWRLLAPENRDMSDLGRKMNQSFSRDGLPNRFVSLIYIELTPDSGKIRMMNAGHMPGLIRNKGEVIECGPGTTALGLSPESEFHEEMMTLETGTLALFYSDGLTEARNRKGDFFGEERLMKSFSACPALNIESAGQTLLKTVDEFIGDEKASDDLSLILVRRRQ
jgi:serine phosphatase RsbU (regulator of sigma subunit)